MPELSKLRSILYYFIVQIFKIYSEITQLQIQFRIYYSYDAENRILR